MSFYQLSNDDQNYQALALDAMQLFEQLDLGDTGLIECVNLGTANQPFSDKWGAVTSNFIIPPGASESAEVPAISLWQSGCLLLSDYAHACLKEILIGVAEPLPIIVSGKQFYLHNLLAQVAADREKSELVWSGDELIDIKRLAVDASSAEGKDVFLTVLDGYGGIFCSEGFKRTCEEFDLGGLYFKS